MDVNPVGSAATRGRSAFGRIAAPADGKRLLVVPDDVRRVVIDHMRRCLPYEGVGLLAVAMRHTGVTANRYYPGRNVDSSPQRYTMDPAEVLSALRDMERRRLRLGAIVHSHPDTPPVPSATDLAEASFPGVFSLIVAFTPEVDLRAWNFSYSDVGIAVGSDEVRIEESSIARGGAARKRIRHWRALSASGSDLWRD